MFTIEDAKRVQRDLRLGDMHVAFIDPEEGFVLAHTDAERASGMNLRDCPVHLWLDSTPIIPGESACLYGNRNCCFRKAGWYVIAGLHEVRGLAL